MPMFDTIQIHLPLPDGIPDKYEKFHTKCFDNLMENYVISVNGEIYKEDWERKIVEDDTKLLGFRIEKLPNGYIREYLTNLNAEITFHSNRRDRLYRDYHATIKNGKVIKIWYTDK